MKHPAVLTGICIVLLAAALMAAGCTLISPGAKVTPTPVPVPVTTVVPVTTPDLSTCGFTTCHGLDLACGPDAPQVCTMEYRIGDKCRKYARCDATGGSCQLVRDPKFAVCRTCVEQCQVAAGADSLAAFSCEEKC